jgi:hypothetical protein
LKAEASYNFRIIAGNCVGCSEPFIIEETFSASKANIPKSKTFFTRDFYPKKNLLMDCFFRPF